MAKLKYCVMVGDLYFVRFDEIEIVMIIDDMLGSLDHIAYFDELQQAQTIADQIRGIVEEVERHDR